MCFRVNDATLPTGPSLVLDVGCTPFASGFDDGIGGNTAFMNAVPVCLFFQMKL